MVPVQTPNLSNIKPVQYIDGQLFVNTRQLPLKYLIEKGTEKLCLSCWYLAHFEDEKDWAMKDSKVICIEIKINSLSFNGWKQHDYQSVNSCSKKETLM